MRTRLIIAVVAVAVAIWAGWNAWGPRHAPAGQPPMTVITPSTIAAVESQIDAGPNETRLVLLLSPT